MSRSTRADIRRKLSVLWAIALVGSLVTGTFSAGGAALGDEQLDTSSEQIVETDASAVSDTTDGSTVTASTDDATVSSTEADAQAAADAAAQAAAFATTAAATNPAIAIAKRVSTDGGVTYVDADSAPGPAVTEGATLFFDIAITNTGDTELVNVVVSDPSLDLSSCSFPTTLPLGASAACEIGPVAAGANSTSTATVTALESGGVTVPLPDQGLKRSYWFLFEDGTIVTGATGGGDVDMGLSADVHVSCSDKFGFEDSDPSNDGWGEKGGPVEGVDPKVVLFRIDQYKDGNLEKSCGFDELGTSVSDSDIAYVDVDFIEPDIDIEKFVSVDGKATWHDADSATGPEAVIGSDVYFRFEVTNTGDTELDNISLTDTDFSTSSCVIPGTLAIGGSFDCEIGPFTAASAQHTNTATVNATGPGGGVPPDWSGLKHTFVFVFADGSVITGTSESNAAEIGLSEPIHVSCSDDFGFGNSEPDGWGEKGAPVQGVDPSPVVSYLIIKHNSSGVVDATCGEGDPTGTPVSDSDDANYFGRPPAPAIDVEKYVSVDGGITYDDADDPTGPATFTGNDVFFRFEVTNTGETELTDLTLTDDVFSTSSCVIPSSLAPGGSYDCEIGPFAAIDGQHTNTATAMGVSGTDAELPPFNGDKHGYVFIFADGTVLSGNADSKDADIGLSDDVHLSCSDKFGFEDSDPTNDGWGEKGSPVEGVDPSPLVAYLIVEYKDDGTISKSCGFGDLSSSEKVTDTDDANYIAQPPVPDVDIEKATNGEDADAAPGPFVAVGDSVTWTYTVSNTGESDLTNITVTDDQGVTSTLIDDGDGDAVLSVGETWVYEATGVAVAGQYTNVGTVNGVDVNGVPVTDEDPSNYFGADPDIDIQKDPDLQTVVEGGTAEWTITVTNTGNVTLIDVTVTDALAPGCDASLGTLIPGQATSYDCSLSGVLDDFTNVAAVEGQPVDDNGDPFGDPVTDDDPADVIVDPLPRTVIIEKSTNGEDADTPTGPYIAVGDTVTWTYEVTNNGGVDLFDIVVTDDQGVATTLIDDGDGDAVLSVGETWVYEATGVAVAGQYANVGTVNGVDSNGTPVTDDDPSHYFGADPQIDLLKLTNGEPGSHGTNCVDGPTVIPGSTVTWTYEVSNIGNVDVTGVVVTDDQGVIPVFVSGDDGDGILNPGETWIYEGTGIATAGVYENLGTAIGDSVAGPVQADDPSCYFGAAPSIDIEKATNGEDADTPTGPIIPVGDAVTWTYVVTNDGNVDLTNVIVTDDQGVALTLIDDGDGDAVLAIGETWTYEGTGVAAAGQYENLGSVTAVDADGMLVADNDPSHYFGADPAIDILKFTNGEPGSHGSNCVDGPYLIVGSPVTWTYEVTNTGNVDITDVAVTDDQGVVPVFVSGDDGDGILNPGETWLYSADGTATAGLYENLGTAVGDSVAGPVQADDPSCYFGADPSIDIEKATNGQDADIPTGPVLEVGSDVTWTYVVTNDGNVDLTNVIVTDDQGVALTLIDDGDGDAVLAVGETWTYEGNGTAVVGQYENLGSVTALDPQGTLVADNDPSHYLGVMPGIQILKFTNGEPGSHGTNCVDGPYLLVGSPVTWTYEVTNTGTVDITDVVVTDDQGVIPIFVSGDDGDGILNPGETWLYSADGTATAGLYENTGLVEGNAGTTPVADADPSCYFGADPSIDIEKATNGEDADTPTGPVLVAGTDVVWTYVVTNDGNVDLSNVVVTDDQGVAVTLIDDGDGDAVLAVGESWTYEGTGTAQLGQYANIGSVTAEDPEGNPVDDDDPSHYLGVPPDAPAIQILKFTNGEPGSHGTNCVDGPYLIVGSPVTWTYEVTNIGNLDIFSVGVSDDIIGPIAGPDSGDDGDGVLNPGETWIYSIGGTAVAGLYENTGIVNGDTTAGGVSDTDPSCYFGADPSIDIEKATNGEDADTPTGPIIPVGDAVTWTYVVTNDGNVDLSNVVVTDDQGVAVTLIDDGDGDAVLAVGESWTYEGTGLAAAGQYANIGSVTAEDPDGNPVDDTDPSHYFGADPAIDILKFTNGEPGSHGTNCVDGPYLLVGSPVTWTYEVTNTGNVDITDVVVTDDQGVVPVFVSGDDGDGILNPGETWLYSADGTATAGLYENLGTAAGDSVAGPVVADDPSCYFGADPSIDIEKATNGEDADTPTGPVLIVGEAVTWTYVVTNTGNVDIANVVVTDDILGVIAGPDSGDDGDGILNVGEVWTYSTNGVAELGQYANLGTVTGEDPEGNPVDDDDPSHYLGVPPDAPAIQILKFTNGEPGSHGTNCVDGPYLLVGSPVTWTYEVTNIGNVDITDVVVTDDQGVIPVFVSGDDGDGILNPGETWLYSADGTATAGVYENTGIVDGDGSGTPVSDTDPSCYFGADPSIDIEKATNGEDADTPTGPVLLAGDTVTWTYVVTNTGNVDLDNVIVTDDQGEIPVFVSGDDGDGLLNPGESWTYEATGTAVVGQYANLGSVTAVDAGGTLVADNDPSHYLVEDIVIPPAIHIEKTTNGFDADLPTGPEVEIGKAIVWRYFVTNTGTTPLSMVKVTDDKGVIPILISGDTNGNLLLDPGEEWLYRAFGKAVAGQYENLGSVTAKDPGGVMVADNDPSHYFGKLAVECPLTGDGVIFISDKALLNRDGRDTFGPVAVSIGPGTYEVTLAGFDFHTTKPLQVQPNEQYFIELLDVNGNVVYTSPAIADLPQTEDWIIDLVDTNAVVTGDATQLFAFHIRVANSNLNSIIPVCAQFVPVTPLPAGSIGDFVWEDVNADGVQDVLEPGIEGAVVELWDSGLTTLLATTTTDAAGKYLFEDLPAGDYIVIFDGSAANAALLPSPADAGSNDEVDSDAAVDSGQSPVITLGIDEDNLTIDAGFYLPVALGDRVWEDVNGDGIQDAGEPGVAGVTVLLKDASGTVIDSTTTDADGLYLFSDLTPGTYSIGVELPAGFSFSPADQGADDAADSDIDPATAMSGNVTLDSGDTNLTLDAGLVDLARGISIEKSTNGEDADAPTGPLVRVGDTVTWTYEVTNAGQTDLFDVVVTDDQGALPVFVSGDDGDGILNPGETWIYEATGVAVAGQYANLGSVSASDVVGPLTDDDPSHYFGASPSILIEKDPDTQTVVEGGTAFWTITVTNTGNVTLSAVTVSDPLAPDCDANLGTLIPGQSTSYDCELAGVLASFTNVADVIGTPPVGPPVVDDDPADVVVTLLPRSISIEKATNGQDADTPTGPFVPVGDTVTWTYEVTNGGGVDLFDVVVTDDQGAIPVFVSGDDGDGVLNPGETWIYEATGVAVAGQYANVGTVVATDGAGPLIADDPSHYFGSSPSILIVKDPDTQTVIEGGTATWTITVTNTGNVTLTDVTVSDPLAPNCDATLGTMAPGDSQTYDCSLDGVVASFTNVADVIGTPPVGPPVVDDDPADVVVTLLPRSISIEKSTNGVDADAPSGPLVPVGGAVTWTYTVTNTGGVDLVDVVVTDDQGVVPVLIDNADGNAVLSVGETWVYEVSGVAVAGQYENLGSVTATDVNGMLVGDNDPSHYFGTDPSILIEKDPDTQTVVEGGTATWTITVTNTGNMTLIDVTVADVLAPGCDAVILSPMAPGDVVSYDCELAGVTADFTNVASVVGQPVDDNGDPVGDPVTDDDPADVIVTLLSALGDRVWEDVNGNGIQDQGELGIGNVTVNLMDSGMNVIDTTVTGPSGLYSFVDLLPGEYFVQFITPAGVVPTTSNVGADDTVDSDAGVDGKTPLITLPAGTSDDTWDAGFYALASIGDTVWRDRGSEPNGIQDAGEPGVAGVAVDLLDDNGNVIASTVTNADGFYEFTGLAPGTYQVVFTAPDGATWTDSNVGADDTVDSDADAAGVTPAVTVVSGENNDTIDGGLVIPIDLEIAKEALPEGVFPGAEFIYELRINNVGGVDAQGVVVLDLLPYRDVNADPQDLDPSHPFAIFPCFSETEECVGNDFWLINSEPLDDERNPFQNSVFVDYTAPAGITCVYFADVHGVECEVGDLAAGESLKIDLTLQMGIFAQNRVWNRTYIYGDDVEANINKIDPTTPCATLPGVDPDAQGFGCNHDKKNETIVGGLDLGVVMSVDAAQASPGDLLTYTIDATNYGAAGAREGHVVIALPDGFNVKSISAPECSVIDLSLDCAYPLWVPATFDLLSSLKQIELTGWVDMDFTGELVARSFVEDRDTSPSAFPDGDPTNNDAQVSTLVAAFQTPVIDLEATITAEPTSVQAGQDSLVTATITNTGPDDATGVVASIMLPTQASIVSSAGSGVLLGNQWLIGDLAAGASVSVQLMTTINEAGSFLVIVEVTEADQGDSDSIPGDGTGDDFAMAPVTATSVLQSQATTTTTTAATGTTETLPRTGLDSGALGGLGIGLILLGGFAVVGVRRREDFVDGK